MDLYETPENTFVAQFIGSPRMNFFDPTDLEPGARDVISEGQILGLRPEHLSLTDAEGAMVGDVLELVEQLGEYSLAHFTMTSGRQFTAKLAKPPMDRIGQRMHFGAAPELIHRFYENTGARCV